MDIEHLYKADANSILSAIESASKTFSSDCKPENENKLECYLEQDLESLHKSLLL